VAICLSFIYSTDSIIIIAVFILYGLHKAALEKIQNTYATELSPDCFQASGLGVFQIAIGICALPASLIAGFLWGKVNYARAVLFISHTHSGRMYIAYLCEGGKM
jgi:hypothetical protein